MTEGPEFEAEPPTGAHPEPPVGEQAELPRGEQAELPDGERRLGEQLSAERPVPQLRFRAALRTHIAELDPGHGPRPENLRLIVGACLLAGLLLLVLGGLLSVGGG